MQISNQIAKSEDQGEAGFFVPTDLDYGIFRSKNMDFDQLSNSAQKTRLNEYKDLHAK